MRRYMAHTSWNITTMCFYNRKYCQTECLSSLFSAYIIEKSKIVIKSFKRIELIPLHRLLYHLWKPIKLQVSVIVFKVLVDIYNQIDSVAYDIQIFYPLKWHRLSVFINLYFVALISFFSLSYSHIQLKHMVWDHPKGQVFINVLSSSFR